MAAPIPIDRKLLRTLEPLSQLDAPALDELAAKLAVEELPAGRRLFSRGQQDPWSYYLLAGEVQIESERPLRIAAGTPAARQPLAPGAPRPAAVLALTVIRFIRIDNTLIEVLRGGGGGCQLEEIDAGSPLPELRLFHRIYHDYMAERLELPHLPDLALRVRQAAESEEADAAAVARIIQADPVLAAKLVQVANSPLYGVQTPIYNLRSAVMFLGLAAVRNLVLAYTLKDLFRTRSQLLDRTMRELWSHSTLISALGLLIGRLTPGIDADRAALMGLLHDVGKLPIINYADRLPELAQDGAALAIALERLRGPVGAMLLRRWKFGDEMVAMALAADEATRDDAPHPDHLDVIIVAQQIEMGADLAACPAAAKVMRGRLLLSPEAAGELLAQAREEVADLLFLFG